jgi:hypothetical protein
MFFMTHERKPDFNLFVLNTHCKKQNAHSCNINKLYIKFIYIK